MVDIGDMVNTQTQYTYKEKEYIQAEQNSMVDTQTQQCIQGDRNNMVDMVD